MILADTSIWINHLKQKNPVFSILVSTKKILVHPFVIGELAMGALPKRNQFLQWINNLPKAVSATHEEVLLLVERFHLAGKGLGFIDANLLAAAHLNSVRLWTHDKRLHALAETLGVAYHPVH